MVSKVVRLVVAIIGLILAIYSFYAFAVLPLSPAGETQGLIIGILGVVITFGGAYWAGMSEQ